MDNEIKVIQVIQTEFDGYLFRSRLEARWAVFFNELGIKYEYEKEGYELPSGRYLPDFWLPELDIYVEIKSREYSLKHHIELWDLSCEFEEVIGKSLYICGHGIPNENEAKELHDFMYNKEGMIGTAIKNGDMPYLWCECPYCNNLDIQFDGRAGRNNHKKSCILFDDKLDSKHYNASSQRLLSAYKKARQARFEFI